MKHNFQLPIFLNYKMGIYKKNYDFPIFIFMISRSMAKVLNASTPQQKLTMFIVRKVSIFLIYELTDTLLGSGLTNKQSNKHLESYK